MELASIRRPLRGALLLAPTFLAAGALAIPAAAQVQPAERFERTVPLASGGIFSISNVNGSVRIEGWDREEAQITAVKSSTGGADELAQVEIAVLPAPQGISVETRYPQGGSAEVSVEFHVRVPAHVRLDHVNTVNGSVTVRDVSGSGSLVAINGSVVLANGAGNFSARATNGNVTLELVSLEDSLGQLGHSAAVHAGITAQTVNGSVILALPADAGADLEAHTQNGDFSSDIPLLAESSSAGRTVRGRIGPGGAPISLRTVNGSIRLRLARPLV